MYKVILVDDEPLIISGLKKKIPWGDLGFLIIGTANDSETALTLIEKENPDLILVDVRIPPKNGLALMEEVLSKQSCKFIIISGYSDFSYAQKALQLGAIDYIVKPISVQTLHAAVMKSKDELDHDHRYTMNFSQKADFINANKDVLDEKEILSQLQIEKKFDRWFCLCGFASTCSYIGRSPLSFGKIYELCIEENRIFYLLNCSGAVQDIYNTLQKHFVSIVLSCTKPFSNIGDIYLYMKEASELLDCSFYDNETRFFTRTSENGVALSSLLESVINAYKFRNQKLIFQLLDNVPKILLENHLSMHYFERFYNTLIHQLSADFNTSEIEYLSTPELLHTSGNILNAIEYIKKLVEKTLGQADTSDNRYIVLQIRNYVDQHFSENYSLNALSAKYYIDVSYLSRIFKEEVGKNFSSYITRVKIKHACDMLINTSISAEQISKLCGYNDFSYFNRVFKKNVGTTPTQYRTKGNYTTASNPMVI